MNTMKTNAKEIRLQGSPICAGIAIGTPYFFAVAEDEAPKYTIQEEEVQKEITRYRQVLNQCQRDVKDLQSQLEAEGAMEGISILDTQLEIMRDPLITTSIEEEIRLKKENAESVFLCLIKSYEEKFNQISDPFFRERFKDILDVCHRIMGYFRDNSRSSLAHIPENSIVFAQELAPSATAEAKRSQVKAFVTAASGGTSHAAIVAKAKGIPYVASVNLEGMEEIATDMDKVVVDGRTGDIVLNPTDSTLESYLSVQSELEGQFKALEETGFLPAETYDGYSVGLSANMEMISDLDTLQEYGSGIGLFRSEYIVLSKDHFPSEEEQFVLYRRLVEKMRGLPVVIRTFDLGGDKLMGNQQEADKGTSAFLGFRAIRLMLKEKDVFKAQLRAILRAAAYGDVSIMFPMIVGLGDLREGKKLLNEAREELEKSRKKFSRHIRMGCMIEVPSAAVICDVLAKECDFLSIGTNDLMQYSLAVDRGFISNRGTYSPTHPSIIRLIRMVVSEGARQGIPVTVCGEVAADPQFTALLIGLGVKELSVAQRYIPMVKNAIRNTSILEASQLAEKVLSLTTAMDVQEVLEEAYQKLADDYQRFSRVY